MLAIHQDELTKLDATAALLERIGSDVLDMVEIRAEAAAEAERLRDLVAKVREFIAPEALIDEAAEMALSVEDEEDRISFDGELYTWRPIFRAL